jgi:TusA-related sulfurtransferase
MKLSSGIVILVVGVLAGPTVWSAAQDQESAPTAEERAEQGGHGMMRGGMGHGQRGMGMMGMGMMHGSGMTGACPMMGPGVAVKVEKIKNGATLTLTSEDPKMVRRIQIHAEILRLMHELQSTEQSERGE